MEGMATMKTLKRLVILGLGAIVVILLFLWQGLPRLLKSQAEAFISEKTGHRLVMELPEFDPFELALKVTKLRLSDPQQRTLLACEDLYVDLSAASLTQRALVFDALRLAGLYLNVTEQPEGQLNWTPFLTALQGGREKDQQAQGLPRLEIRRFALSRGRIDYADQRRSAAGFATRIEPLEVELEDLSTLPDKEGRYRLTARSALGARIDLAGRIDLDPLRVTGHLELDDLQLAKLGPYLATLLPAPPEGALALAADFQAGNDGQRFDATISGLQAKLTGLRLRWPETGAPVAEIDALEVKDGRFHLADQQLALAALTLTDGRLALPGVEAAPHFARLAAEDLRASLSERKASMSRLTLTGARLQLQRDKDGRIDLVAALQALAGAKHPPAAQAQDAPKWRYQVDKIEVSDLGVRFRDLASQPAFELILENIGAEVANLSEDLNAPLPVKLSFAVAGGGRGEAQGKITPASAAAELEFKLVDLALKPAQPFLAAKTTLTLADGRLSAQGRARHDARGPEISGECAVRDLRLMEPGYARPLLAWRSLSTRRFSFAAQRLDLGELRLTGLVARLLIDKDKNVNLKRVMKSEAAAGSGAGAEQAAPSAAAPAPSFVVNIDRLRFSDGEMDFADESLVLPFATRIHDLRGSIAGISNRPGAIGVIELEGAVDDFGLARAAGQVELGNPTNGLDMRVQFRNIEMTRLTPYTATFAGRKIDAGKLSLDLEYKIQQRQLTGDNQVIMDQLTLGERVESPSAKDLPLDLAIALLQDAEGRIDLGLPVSGSLDDPQFSYGGLIWKALTNVLTKIVTAPFRALGALFGGNETLAEIVFEPGMAQLTPPEREKALKLATALGKRPKLALTIAGVYAEADRRALQDAQLRRSVLLRAGQSAPEGEDPGPLSTQQPKIRAALEALYKERFGAADFAALQEGFRKANPGRLEESAARRLVSRVMGLWREQKTLSEEEVSRLEGADFYAVLFERLREREMIDDARLQALAQQRGAALHRILTEAGVAASRLELAAPAPAKPEETRARGILARMIPRTLSAEQ